MYHVGKNEPSETLFPTYVPLSMVKEIMKEKGLLASTATEDL
jgi:hypothetical protein